MRCGERANATAFGARFRSGLVHWMLVMQLFHCVAGYAIIQRNLITGFSFANPMTASKNFPDRQVRKAA